MPQSCPAVPTRQASGWLNSEMLHPVCPAQVNRASRVLTHAGIFLLCVLLGCAGQARAQVTLLVPSRASVEALPQGKDPAGQAPQQDVNTDVPGIDEEVDILVTLMRPFTLDCLDMDMPQLFAVLRYDEAMPARDGVLQGDRRDLLGDVEKISYADKKAWGANVALEKPGLYQFSIDTRPWWDAPRNRFIQHYVKTMLPVYGVERGWDTPLGQRFEIQPLTRPFGMTAPALFSGRALFNGDSLKGVAVRLVRIKTDKSVVPTPWHEELVSITDAAGQFAFVVNHSGWWCCMALTAGDPLKGPDGALRPLELGALFWFYVDGPMTETRKR